MFGSIHHIESSMKIPVIPAGAVVHSGDQTIVFVERAPGRFEEQTRDARQTGGHVRPGPERGLEAGDSIVVDGVMLLQGLARAS